MNYKKKSRPIVNFYFSIFVKKRGKKESSSQYEEFQRKEEIPIIAIIIFGESVQAS